jgi:hypothetical protein
MTGIVHRTVQKILQWTLLCPFLFGVAHAQVLKLEGRVVDAVTGNALAFVHITVNDQREGATTGIQGFFGISSPEPIEVIHLSYVGYELKSLRTDHLHGKLEDHTLSDVEIRLTPGTLYLQELIFKAGENPADIIIRRAVANKDKNNPEKLTSFSYTSYNKFIIDADVGEKDSVRDGDRQDIRDYLAKRYLFLIESVTERKYKFPGRSKEIVLATRVSGLQRPLFTALANTFQPFSFYDDHLSILGKNYLNPLSKNSEDKYFFWLQDSMYSHDHKVYIVSFEPMRKNFDGLKGLLYINTHKYAVENVIAETTDLLYNGEASAEEPRSGADVDFDADSNVPRPRKKASRKDDDDFQARLIVRVQQKYDLLDGEYWFPLQLNTDIEITDSRGKSSTMLRGQGRSYLRDIVLFDTIAPGTFDRLAVDYHPMAGKRDSAYWDQYRTEPLSSRGVETYKYLDSVGRAENFDRTLLAISALSTGKIPAGPIDIDAASLLDFNLYERVRVGFGAHTNARFSEVFTLGGYGAWAFGDRNFKYGGDLSIRLTRKNALKVHGRYSKDVVEAGGTNFYKFAGYAASQQRRRFMIERMDWQESWEGAVSFYALKYLDAKVALRTMRREPTYDYAYFKGNGGVDGLTNVFNITEIGVGIKYAFREQFIELLGNQVSMGTDYPMVWLNYTRGMDGLLNGQYSYWKMDLLIRKKWLVRGFGQPAITLGGGIARGELPYPVLYNGNGSYESTIPLEAYNTFQTMRLHEFASDQYLALHYSHVLGTLKWHPRISTPTFVLNTSAAIGNLRETGRHITSDGGAFQYKTMEKGYLESGVVVRDIYKFMGVMGFGLGYFYRYGPYALDTFVDNSAIKITLDFGL